MRLITYPPFLNTVVQSSVFPKDPRNQDHFRVRVATGCNCFDASGTFLFLDSLCTLHNINTLILSNKFLDTLGGYFNSLDYRLQTKIKNKVLLQLQLLLQFKLFTDCYLTKNKTKQKTETETFVIKRKVMPKSDELEQALNRRIKWGKSNQMSSMTCHPELKFSHYITLKEDLYQ